MKKILILLLLLFISFFSFPQSVNNNEIKTVALNFYNYLTRDNPTKNNVKIIKQYTHKFKGVKTYATVVFDNNDWVLISTDKSTDPILAFSDEGSYTDSINPNAKFWFELFNYYVYNAKVLKIHEEENKNYSQLWNDLLNNHLAEYMQKNLGNKIKPLLTTEWGQSESNKGNDYNAYNYYAPSGYDANGNACNQTHALAGCPAVAVGQILRYWEYPNCNLFDWSNMPDKLKKKNNNPNYTIQKKEIANLLRNLADKMQDYMNNGEYYFGCYGSGCITTVTLTALINNFYYTNATLVERNNQSITNWENMLYSELDNGHPILYRGVNYSGGHIFVCDGYRHIFDDKFHFNFGWNGDHDGYYKSVDPFGFITNQMAIINIYPTCTVNCNSNITVVQSYKYSFFTQQFFYQPEAGNIYSSPSPIIIENGDNVHYQAYNEIVLENFETEDGAEFIAEIIPCPINCNFTNYKGSKSHYDISDVTNKQNIDSLQANNEIYIYPKDNNKIDLSNQASGIYLLKLHSENNIYTQKIIKQ